MFVSFVGIVSSIGERNIMLPGALVGAQQRPGAVWFASAGASSPPPFLDAWCLLRGASSGWGKGERDFHGTRAAGGRFTAKVQSFHSKGAVLVTLRTAGASSLALSFSLLFVRRVQTR